ncbi:TetR/AcrR family transcriptional regulator [Yinghuangia seranimata]|uniref:TetR/AcrR family transcriptional regulator n=1 Tax=Yinghuangia seranimata TaxID=408067 RepID=UPI00248AE8DC|nr:TetR/AcrR family transcriptional regulator [Yinghuangia seranimata]MDI2130889.1 TetR/AcrR family transcriptional regulator [Yinghuangia seranimata]
MPTPDSSAAERPTRSRNRRGEGGRLRQDILDAATALIEREGGATNLSLRQLAREAGISAPSVYAHFTDLDDVVDTVLNGFFDQLRDAIAAANAAEADPVAALHAGCGAYTRFALDHPGRYRALFDRRPTGPDATPSRPVPVRTDVFQTLVDAVATCAAAGRSATTEPFADAAAIWAALHGAVLLRLSVPGFPWPDLPVFTEALVTRTGLITD